MKLSKAFAFRSLFAILLAFALAPWPLAQTAPPAPPSTPAFGLSMSPLWVGVAIFAAVAVGLFFYLRKHTDVLKKLEAALHLNTQATQAATTSGTLPTVDMANAVAGALDKVVARMETAAAALQSAASAQATAVGTTSAPGAALTQEKRTMAGATHNPNAEAGQVANAAKTGGGDLPPLSGEMELRIRANAVRGGTDPVLDTQLGTDLYNRYKQAYGPMSGGDGRWYDQETNNEAARAAGLSPIVPQSVRRLSKLGLIEQKDGAWQWTDDALGPFAQYRGFSLGY